VKKPLGGKKAGFTKMQSARKEVRERENEITLGWTTLRRGGGKRISNRAFPSRNLKIERYLCAVETIVFAGNRRSLTDRNLWGGMGHGALSSRAEGQKTGGGENYSELLTKRRQGTQKRGGTRIRPYHFERDRPKPRGGGGGLSVLRH